MSGLPVIPGAGPNHGDVESPCIGVCTLGPGDMCLGCLRYSDEIGNWLNYSEQDRKRIMSLSSARLEALFAR